MEIPPGRAPFNEDEDYTPMRKPKSAANTPTHSNSYSTALNLEAPSSSGWNQGISTSKLSPNASEFKPSNVQSRLQHQQRFQQQHLQQTYNKQRQQQHHQYQHNQHQQYHGHHQPYQHQHQHQHHHQQHHQHQQQHYDNGYQQMPQHLGHQQQQPYVSQIASLTGSVQERLHIGSNANNYSANATPNSYSHSQRHSYQNSGPPAQTQAQAQSEEPEVPEVDVLALNYLEHVIQCLTENPGKFDSVATRFLHFFEGMENNSYVLAIAMEDIFQQSIKNPNFRYMGAKLYNLLHMLNLNKDSLFHELLKYKLADHQHELETYMQDDGKQKLVRETALFLAELYMQLRGDDSRIHLIAENIVLSLKKLLCRESADNVRCICLTLKLAGYDLTTDCPQDMQQIIEQLDGINRKQPGKYPLAANVISLQKNNWGRKLSSSNSMCEEEEKLKRAEPLRTSDEPIFYGPDGRVLSEEESAFLTEAGDRAPNHFQRNARPASTDSEPDMEDLDPGMDQEAAKAYQEFLLLNASS